MITKQVLKTHSDESAKYYIDKLCDLADVEYSPINADFKNFEKDYIKLSFKYCQEIIKHHSKTFNLASSLLDIDRRSAITSLYGFCRITDDIIDKDLDESEEILENWRKDAHSNRLDITDPVLFSWLYTRQKYRIPVDYMDQLIRGVRMDTIKFRYNTFEELIEYCYYVASTVGLMSMHVIGFKNIKAIRYAIQMGVALQLTNIIRDVGEDFRMGRIYLPQDELDQFGVIDEHFKNGIIDEKWKDLMAFQIKRARLYYKESWEGLSFLESKGKWSIAAAASMYREILKIVERNNYDNLNQRAFVSKKRKLYILSKLIVE